MTFWKRNRLWIVFIGFLLLVALIAGEASGQGISCPDEYGCAYFYRSDIWPKDGLVEHWTLDPGVRGDQMDGSGDFETWTGAEGGCTDCPTGWSCSGCGPSDIDQETTYLFSRDTSVKISDPQVFAPILSFPMDYEANEAYMFVFWCRSDAGTEDALILAGNALATETYDFATDTWIAAATAMNLTNIPTTWTPYVGYINVGAAAKSGYQLALLPGGATGDAIYVDGVTVHRLYGTSVTGARENVLSVPVGSDPWWGYQQCYLTPRIGSGPAGWWGMDLDGDDDYVSCADGTCSMDPAAWMNKGLFSVGCRFTTGTVAAGSSVLVSKWNETGNQRGWYIGRSTADLEFHVSDDGTNEDSNAVTVLTAGVLHGFVSTFDPSGGSGACENKLYYNATAVDTDATMTECTPFDNTASFEIGALSGASFWLGTVEECTLWNHKLSAVEANKYISPYFPRTNLTPGFYVSTCSQATAHATCSTQVCRDGTPNTCQAEGTGTMPAFGSYVEILDNNSFELYVGDPSNMNFNDWTDGGYVTAYLADAKHGGVSARMKGGSLTSECIAGSPSKVFIELSTKQLDSGGGVIEVWLREYDTGFCTTQLAINTVVSCTPGGVWDACGGLWDSFNAATSSYKIQIVDTVDGDILVDSVSVKQASYHTPFVHCPSGSGTLAYDSHDYRLYNPVSGYIDSEDGYAYASGFCASIWVYTDWAGDDGVEHYLFNSPATAGANNRWYIAKSSGSDLYFTHYDSAGNTRGIYYATSPATWSAADWKYVEVCTNNSDNTTVGHYYNAASSTWYDLGDIFGAGTGIQDGQSSELQLGHRNNGAFLDGYVSEVHVSPYPSGAFVWPNDGFNGGRPPVNDGRPY